jgi:hypothetical protein
MAIRGELISTKEGGYTFFGIGSDGKAYPVSIDPSTGQLIVQLAAAPTIDIGKVTLIDGTTDTIKQAVKAASTAAVATDPAAVVALSPNNGLGAGENYIGQAGGISSFVWADDGAGGSGAKTRPNNATAYAANKTIADGTASLFTFTNFFRKNGGTAWLTEVKVDVSKSGGISIPSGVAVRAILYNVAITDPGADQSAYSQLEANRTKRQGYVDLTVSNTGDGSSDSFSLIGTKSPPMLLQAGAASRALNMLLIATGAWTPTAQSIWIPAVRAAHD